MIRPALSARLQSEMVLCNIFVKHLEHDLWDMENDCNDSSALIRRHIMAAITIRNLDAATKARLRMRAASHDRWMEEEARMILGEALQNGDEKNGLATLIHKRFMAAGGVELPLPERKQRARKPEQFG